MSNTYTLATLKTRSRERADQENSEFVGEAELTSYINASYAELYDILVGRFEDYYTLSTTSTIASGSNTITLPTDFYKLRGIDYKIDSTNWVTLAKFNFLNRNVINSSAALLSLNGRVNAYRIVGPEILIEPEGTAPGTYRIWYTPIYTPLVASTDTIDGISGWEEYVIIDVAIKMMAKEESSTTHLKVEKEAMLKRIEAMAQNRDSGQPETVTDVSVAYLDPSIATWRY